MCPEQAKTAKNRNGSIGDGPAEGLVPADFALLADVDKFAQAGYVWASTTYERDGSTEYDSTQQVWVSPQPGPRHAMMLGMVPVSG